MKNFQCNEVVIVGFDGTVGVECGRAAPVAYDRESDRYFKVPGGPGDFKVEAVYTEQEIKEYERAGHLTMLDTTRYQPVPAFSGVVAVFVTQQLLDAIRHKSPPSLPERDNNWQLLPESEGGGESVWVTFLEENVSLRLLDSWAEGLMAECTTLLEAFFLQNEDSSRKRAEYLADVGLCTAKDPDLRIALFTLYGLTLKHSLSPGRIESLYDLTVRFEFPGLSEVKDFHRRLDRLEEDLRPAVAAAGHYPQSRRGQRPRQSVWKNFSDGVRQRLLTRLRFLWSSVSPALSLSQLSYGYEPLAQGLWGKLGWPFVCLDPKLDKATSDLYDSIRKKCGPRGPGEPGSSND